MTTALINLETKEQVNLFQLLAKTVGVSFEILHRKKEVSMQSACCFFDVIISLNRSDLRPWFKPIQM